MDDLNADDVRRLPQRRRRNPGWDTDDDYEWIGDHASSRVETCLPASGLPEP